MRPTAQSNHEDILSLKNDIDWMKKMILGIFGAIILNIIINLLNA